MQFYKPDVNCAIYVKKAFKFYSPSCTWPLSPACFLPVFFVCKMVYQPRILLRPKWYDFCTYLYLHIFLIINFGTHILHTDCKEHHYTRHAKRQRVASLSPEAGHVLSQHGGYHGRQHIPDCRGDEKYGEKLLQSESLLW